MKHPALVRVFAVVLAIVCIVMLAAGVLGLEKARVDYENNLAAVDKMLADIDEYKTLVAENEGKEDYDTVSESLSQMQEQHEDVSAEHRTEIAVYSATKGGIDGAVDMLDEADIAMAQARAQFEAGKAEFEKQYAEFMQGYNGYYQAKSAKEQLEAQVAEIEKQIPGEMAGMDSATVESLKQGLAAAQGAIETQLADAEKELAETTDEARITELNGLIAGLEAQSEENGRQMGALELAAKAFAGRDALNGKIAELQVIVDAVDPATLEAGKAQLDAAKVAMDEGEEQLNSAEYSLYYQRALIWNEIAKLEDQAVELEETKNQLLQESEEIAQKEQLSEEQKQREKRIRSLYLTFMDKPEIEAAVNGGEDFVTAAEAYIVRFNDRNHEENTYRGYACILMIVSMIPFLVCFLASFEIIKKPALARTAAVMLTLCAAGALGLLLYIGKGVSYSAASVTFFAFVQMLVSGRKKRIKVQ